MRIFLAILSALLLAGAIVAALVIWGPFSYLLSPAKPTDIHEPIDDPFTGGTRPGISPTATDPFGTPGILTGTTTAGVPTIVWIMPAKNGKKIAVLPFWSATTTSGTATSSDPTNPPTVIVTFAEGTIAGSSTPAYDLTYFPKDQSFTLSLLREPIGDARKAGEQELMKRLGINQGQACLLRYNVLTSRFVNSFYSGKNLGFSFCQGSPQF